MDLQGRDSLDGDLKCGLCGELHGSNENNDRETLECIACGAIINKSNGD